MMAAGTAADLPVRLNESAFVNALKGSPNRCVVVVGEPGSGKSTQLPQIMVEQGLGPVAVAQPRRLAAVMLATRVAKERGTRVGAGVGYCVRFEDVSSSTETQIKFFTDGCLLNLSASDPYLREYNSVVLDEAHERSLQSDILLGILKSIAMRRGRPLHLVVTSATINCALFSAYLQSCPVVRVPGRQWPVEILHAADPPLPRGPRELIESACQTCLDVHVNCGEGDILMFLPGRDEIQSAVKTVEELIAAADGRRCAPAVVLPLFGSMSPEMQARVFTAAGMTAATMTEGGRATTGFVRRIVIATNIAETSLTVPKQHLIRHRHRECERDAARRGDGDGDAGDRRHQQVTGGTEIRAGGADKSGHLLAPVF